MLLAIKLLHITASTAIVELPQNTVCASTHCRLTWKRQDTHSKIRENEIHSTVVLLCPKTNFNYSIIVSQILHYTNVGKFVFVFADGLHAFSQWNTYKYIVACDSCHIKTIQYQGGVGQAHVHSDIWWCNGYWNRLIPCAAAFAKCVLCNFRE